MWIRKRSLQYQSRLLVCPCVVAIRQPADSYRRKDCGRLAEKQAGHVPAQILWLDFPGSEWSSIRNRLLVYVALASFVGCVLLRIFTIHHCTWFINSLAHMWGSRTYSAEQTAADNAVLALLTFGEGYHNYHHTLANDYRNGIRWYHFDPTKWLIWTASKIGLASNLRWVNEIRIKQTLVKNDKQLLLNRIRNEIDETANELREKLEDLSKQFEAKAAELAKAYRELKVVTEERRHILLMEIKRLALGAPCRLEELGLINRTHGKALRIGVVWSG